MVIGRRAAFALVFCAVAVTCLPLVDIGQEQGGLVLVDDDSRLLSPGAPSADASLDSQASKPPSSTKKVHGGIKLAIKVPKITGLPTAAQYKTLGNAAHPYGQDKGEERIEKELKVAEDVHKSSKFMKHAMAQHGPKKVSAKWPAGKPKFTRHKSKPSLRSGAAPRHKSAWPVGGLQFKQPDTKFHDPIEDTPDLGEGEGISENKHETSKPKHRESGRRKSSTHSDQGEDNDQGANHDSSAEHENREHRQHGSRQDDAHSQSDEELGEQRTEDHGSNSRSAGEDDASDESGLQDMLRANGLQTVPSAHWVDVQSTPSTKPAQEQEDNDATELGESAAQDTESDTESDANELRDAAKQEESTAQTQPTLSHDSRQAAAPTEASQRGHRDLGESATISTSQHRDEEEPSEHRREAPTHHATQQAASQTSTDDTDDMFASDNDGADMP